MSANEITDEGVIIILKSIHSNSPLQTLNLTHNIVSRSGLLLIFENFENMHSFQISYMEITDISQTIYTVLVHFNSRCVRECNQFTTSSKMKFEFDRSKICKDKANDNNPDNYPVKVFNISNHNITSKIEEIISEAIQSS